ncbi:hypothetical protein VNO80_25692 [Phaseolus coccineus]|uniref:EF-hand domain-containing protein n=1 Tax=Phaseolus coccineus TaxID=3886 RepID=A0AAN9LVA5_PHACN
MPGSVTGSPWWSGVGEDEVVHGLVDLERLFDGNGLFEIGFNVGLQGGPVRLGSGIMRDVSSDVVEERREAINELCCEDGLVVLLNSAMASAAPNVDIFDAYFLRTDLDRDGRISNAEIVLRRTPPS